MRIRGRYVKSDALFAAYQPARWLVLRGVISHPAPHYPLSRNLPHGNHTHPTLVQLVADGAARVVVAVGQLGGWSLLVCYGLAAQRSKQLRVFRKLETLVLYLQQIGVSRFEVDASSFMLALRQR